MLFIPVDPASISCDRRCPIGPIMPQFDARAVPVSSPFWGSAGWVSAALLVVEKAGVSWARALTIDAIIDRNVL